MAAVKWLLAASHVGDYFPALNEFSTHTVIRPLVQHGRTKRALHSTLDATDGLHAPQLTLSYMHQGQRIQIELQRNDRLLPDAHFLRYQNASNQEDGASGYVVRNFTKADIDLCHYQGHIRGIQDSSVALSTCDGSLNGVVFDGQHTYFIHPHIDGNGRLQDDHYLLRHADMLQQNATCGYDSSEDNHNPQQDDEGWQHEMEQEEEPSLPQRLDGGEFHRMLRRKRRHADESQLIRGPYNANKYSSYVELVIVVDKKLYNHFGANARRVHTYCMDLVNIVNAVYMPLNIFVALVGVVIWNESNEIGISDNSTVTLRNFLNYRSTKLVLEHANDNAQLLTKQVFSAQDVGKALKGTICTSASSGGVIMHHSEVLAVVAATMAHEIGHNFGMDHDSSDCHCPDEKCVMSATSTAFVPVHWSSCSIDQLTIAFSRGMNYCLRNKPTRLFDSPQCGNGFVEPGEQCDCGLPAHCENSCCNAHTCMLHSNASCATGECCDLDTCRPKLAGSACRPTENECDLPEYCTGESEYCPADVFRRDTEPCDNNQAFCFHGTCRSHASQCRILWGSTGDNSVHCYKTNVEGTDEGNCGYNLHNKTFVKCTPEHVHCGMLQCTHLNKRLEFGIEPAAESEHFVNHDRKIFTCRTVLVDLGLETIDPGMTPNGAKCGERSMCVNQKCMPLDRVHAPACPDNCNNNGVCNSRGHCHCDVGFGGESCYMPGYGGSVDSGPATNPSSKLSFERLTCILLFLVVSLLLFFWVVYHFMIRNKFFSGEKLAENMYVSTSSSSNSSDHSTTTCLTSAPPPPIPMHAQQLNSPTNTITNTHSTLPRLKSRQAGSHAIVLPPAMSKSRSNSEVDQLESPWRRKLPTHQLRTAPPVPPHKNISCNIINNNNSNSNNNTLRRKLDITAPRLHATTNTLALTDGAQHIQRNPARFAKK
ncbi:zinc metalloproteinase-disintegrin-like MTP8 [Drosophila innubila]|uniref:zinc metalloproteinase-disintegrin-like MTP8 n=1 Tax=Drosophila innubila TaxID=198719 RepID=UPI00148BF079|nr:zinc metalloproteinase-disintegrin-like MTP8 [Drosophila innubila]